MVRKFNARSEDLWSVDNQKDQQKDTDSTYSGCKSKQKKCNNIQIFTLKSTIGFVNLFSHVE